jgi:asparagine N-glycosylation enzyme membrane subunit Stt3
MNGVESMTTSVVALQADYWNLLGRGVGAIVLYAVVGLVLMLVGFYAIDLASPGPLRKMVDEGKPNAIVISAAGIVSMALIVVLAIIASSGKLAEGLVAAAVFGLVGIAAEVVMVRVATIVLGIDMHVLLASDEYNHEALMVAAAQFALGMVVAFAIL